MANLAISGGEKAVATSLGKPWPIYGDEEKQALAEVLESGVWWRGGYADDAAACFEKCASGYSIRRHRFFLSGCVSGTRTTRVRLNRINSFSAARADPHRWA